MTLRLPASVLPVVLIAGTLALPGLSAPLHAALAADTQSGTQSDVGTDAGEEQPTEAPLTVGSMAIASDSALVVEAMAVDVAVDKVTYAYRLRNKGSAKLLLAASVALPDLEVNSDAATIFKLPSQTAENPVGLVVSSENKPITTTPLMQAVAVGIDRLAELKAENLPLIPFGADIEKALAAAKPETLTKLESLGLVTPRDPSQPDTPVIADWSLRTVHGWMQPLEPNAVTNVTVSFSPVKATYTINSDTLSGFDAIKEQVCLTPQSIAAAKALMTGKDATAEVVDITLANDGPARWLDNPPASVAVRKPKANSVVVFCGIDGASASQPVVTGKMPGSSDAAGLRVLVFSTPGK